MKIDIKLKYSNCIFFTGEGAMLWTERFLMVDSLTSKCRSCPQPIILGMIFIDRKNVGNFAEIKSGIVLKV